MFEHIHSEMCNKLSMQRLNDLVFVYYTLDIHHKGNLFRDEELAPIELNMILYLSGSPRIALFLYRSFHGLIRLTMR